MKSPSAAISRAESAWESLFHEALFQEALFQDALFHEALFQEALFQDALFQEALFHEALFQDASPSAVLFQLATSKLSDPLVASWTTKASSAAFGFGGPKNVAACTAFTSPTPSAQSVTEV